MPPLSSSLRPRFSGLLQPVFSAVCAVVASLAAKTAFSLPWWTSFQSIFDGQADTDWPSKLESEWQGMPSQISMISRYICGTNEATVSEWDMDPAVFKTPAASLVRCLRFARGLIVSCLFAALIGAA